MTALWSVKSRLWELVMFRREVVGGLTFLPEQEEERQQCLAQIDRDIRAFVCEEIKINPNSVHQWMLESKARQEDLAREGRRLDSLLAAEEGDYERAKTLVMEVMAEIGEKRLPVRGTLRVQGNGGQRAVEVRQLELVPEGLKRYTVKMRGDLLFWLANFLGDAREHHTPIHPLALMVLNDAKGEPDLTAIHDALEAGEAVAGCILKDRSESLRVG